MTTAHPTQAPPALLTPSTTLVVFHQDGANSYPIEDDRGLTVGRDESCDIRLDHPQLSRRHFRIFGPPALSIEDLGSVNGTRVNGASLAPRETVPIALGSLIDAGGLSMVLQERAPPRLSVPPTPALRPSFLDFASEEPTQTEVPMGAPGMERVYELVNLVSKTAIPVLVVAETGAGKEVISEMIHARSPRSEEPFVRMNCAAFSETLLESELFGYERGAFTGALHAKVGLIESADRGTLFLDELGEMPLSTQAKLLRVLENGEVLRIGALRPKMVDVRFIGATNKNLVALVAQNKFREDLYFRLNGFTVSIPPLRERRCELARLAREFLDRSAMRSKLPVPPVDDDVIEMLMVHSWPGNLRELRNVMDRAFTLAGASRIQRKHICIDASPRAIALAAEEARANTLPAPKLDDAVPASSRRVRDTAPKLRLSPEEEKERIIAALTEHGWNQSRAAEALGVSRRTLINRMIDFGLRRPRAH